MILSFLIQKGGVGKSTLSINGADYFHRQGNSVLLIDADPQKTASDWASLRKETPFPVMHLARENMAKEIIGQAENYNHVVVDGPPHAEALNRAIIIASDMVVLPIEPSGASDWASRVTIGQIMEARNYKETLKAVFLVSRVIARTVLGKSIRDHVVGYGVPVLRSVVTNRVAFGEALTLGRTIFEHEARGEAADEIVSVMQEIGTFYEEEN